MEAKRVPILATNLKEARRLGLCLIGFHLCLTLQLTGRQDQLILNGLFWAAIASGLWQRRDRLPLQSSRANQRWGFVLLATMVLLAGGILPTLPITAFWVRLIPAIAFGGWMLIVSGLGWRQYASEWILVIILMVPQGGLSHSLKPLIAYPLQTLLAQLSHFFLHYFGVEVTRRGIQLLLPQGSVIVEYGCVGLPLLILLLQLVLLLSYREPLSKGQWFQLIISAIAIFLGVNTLRISLMAWLVNQPEWFDYWHSPTGAEWFSTGAIALLFGVYSQMTSKKAKLV